MTKALPILRPGMKNRFVKEAEAVNQAIKSVGVEVFAAHMQKSVGTVRSEMIPSKSDSAHKIGFDTALAAMFLSEDITPLVIFLDRLDYMVIPAEAGPAAGGRERQSLKALNACGLFAAWLGEALEDGRITDAEWAEGTALLKKLEREASTAARAVDMLNSCDDGRRGSRS